MLQNKRAYHRTAVIWMIFFALTIASCGEPPPRIYRVAVWNEFPPFSKIIDGFKMVMTDLGYVEGKNIHYDIQVASGSNVEKHQILEKVMKDKVDLILAFPTSGAVSVKKAIDGSDIPLIFAYATMEGNDLVDSVRRPGGNTTGVRIPGPELAVKRFEILIELAPEVKRIYIPHDPGYPVVPKSLELLRQAAAAKGVSLLEVPVRTVEDIETDLKARGVMADVGMDAIQLMPERLTQTPAAWAIISKFATEHRLPIVGSSANTADRGALFSYTIDPLEVGRLAAPLADKILNGIPAGTLPVVTPEAYLRLNYKKAQQLGLTVPKGWLSLAREVLR